MRTMCRLIILGVVLGIRSAAFAQAGAAAGELRDISCQMPPGITAQVQASVQHVGPTDVDQTDRPLTSRSTRDLSNPQQGDPGLAGHDAKTAGAAFADPASIVGTCRLQVERSDDVEDAPQAAGNEPAKGRAAPAADAGAETARDDHPGPAASQEPTTSAHSHTEPNYTVLPSFIQAFADIGTRYSAHDGEAGFGYGSFDLYLSPQISAKVKALVETLLEYEDTDQLKIDVERLQIGYTLNNVSTVWLGRFHTPLGAWNTMCHHGQQLQTSILRPAFIDFEDRGGVIPAHTVGLLGNGALRLPQGRLQYDLFVGNSPKIVEGMLSPNNVGNTDHHFSAGFNLGYRPSNEPDGLVLGTFMYRADINDDAVAHRTRVNILGAYAAIDSAGWDVNAEYYRFSDENLTHETGHHGSWAGFAQVGHHFSRWLPYGRLEKTDFDQRDQYFALQASGRSYSRQAVGLRFDVNASTAIKVEAGHTALAARPLEGYRAWQTQLAIHF